MLFHVLVMMPRSPTGDGQICFDYGGGYNRVRDWLRIPSA